jgi:hypothetical protein
MTAGDTTYRLIDGNGLLIEHFGEQLRLAPGEPVCREDPARGAGSGAASASLGMRD